MSMFVSVVHFMHLPNQDRCRNCCSTTRPLCYHHDYVNPATLAVYGDHEEALERDLERDVHGTTVRTHSNIEHSDILAATEGRLNPHCIDFIPDEEDENECATFENLLSEELKLRQIDASGDMENTRERLYACLKHEKELDPGMDTIAPSPKKLQALVPTTKSISYILHSELRIGIKILTMMFLNGIDNHDSKKEQLFVWKVIQVGEQEFSCNRQKSVAMGRSRHQEKEKNGDDTGRIKIGDLRLKGPQVQKFMAYIDLFIQLCFAEDHQEPTLSAMQHYLTAEEILSQYHDYSENDIHQFQDEADLFMIEWVYLYGSSGVTNYVHMVTSGHMRWSIEEYENLHRLSQQGFKSMNALITSFLGGGTQRGGFTSQTNPKIKASSNLTLAST
jgi:hypothetical protein